MPRRKTIDISSLSKEQQEVIQGVIEEQLKEANEKAEKEEAARAREDVDTYYDVLGKLYVCVMEGLANTRLFQTKKDEDKMLEALFTLPVKPPKTDKEYIRVARNIEEGKRSKRVAFKSTAKKAPVKKS